MTKILFDEATKEKISQLRRGEAYDQLTTEERIFLKKMAAFAAYNEAVSGKQIDWVHRIANRILPSLEHPRIAA